MAKRHGAAFWQGHLTLGDVPSERERATRPALMGQVLGIVYRCIATHLIKKAGYTHTTARAGVVTLIQRFGSALNLNIHFHMLFLDGVYAGHPDGTVRFRWVKAPTSAELTQLAHTIARRVGRYLERQGLLDRDADDCRDAGGRATQGAVAENSTLSGEAVDENPLNSLLGHSITYASLTRDTPKMGVGIPIRCPRRGW